MTNATKALVIAFLNAATLAAVAFGLSLSDAQLVAVSAVENSGLALWVGLTYKNSPKRIPDAPGAGSANG